MNFSNYLKRQLSDFVDNYRKYFWQTLGAVLTFTILAFIVIIILLKFSSFATNKNQSSLLNYFFSRYSNTFTYSLVDLSKSVFIFFVVLFSVSIWRLTNNEDEKEELSFRILIKKIGGGDVILFLVVLIMTSIVDYGLFQLSNFTANAIANDGLEKWVYSMLFLLRIYVPLILFSIALYKRTSDKPLRLNVRKLTLLFISLWLYNEFAYEVYIFVRNEIFGLLLSPFHEENKYVYESLLGIILIGFYFVGYYTAMINPLRLLNDDEEKTADNIVIK